MIDSYGAHGTREAWLGIDPGVTTGWAVVDGKTLEVLGSGNADEAVIGDTLDTIIRGMHRIGITLTAVIETMPRVGRHGALGHRLEYVLGEVRKVVEETYDLPTLRIAPGEWKTSRVAKTAAIPSKWNGVRLTPHQRDSLRMTLYAIDREGRRAD